MIDEMPEPTVEEPERFPGGPDSVADEEKYGEIPDTPTTPDLPNDKNPALDDEAPDELDQPEEGDQLPTSDGASEPEKETQV